MVERLLRYSIYFKLYMIFLTNVLKLLYGGFVILWELREYLRIMNWIVGFREINPFIYPLFLKVNVFEEYILGT